MPLERHRQPPPPARNYPPSSGRIPTGVIDHGRYHARFATRGDELDAVLRLRFEIFNREMGEGLEESWQTGRDEDSFDRCCHHLLVEDQRGHNIIGTYRMQTAEMARSGEGFYSAGEFDLAALPSRTLETAVEVGRASIHREHRNRFVLFLLWKGLARYVTDNEKRYLFGCCSLTSQDPMEGWRAWSYLRNRGEVHPSLEVPVLPALALEPPPKLPDVERFELPSLFRTYLRYGGHVVSRPALDRQFKTIDFLVLFDVEQMSERSHGLFFG